MFLADDSFCIHQGFWDFYYTTNITVGTPPQPFGVAIDTTFNEGIDLFIPSVDCEYDRCNDRDHSYNSSLSSTHKANGTHASSHWAGVNFSGYLSRDIVSIGGLEVEDHIFEEWTSSAYAVGAVPWGYDGVLGLAPPWNNGTQEPNMLSNLVTHGKLDSPIFSLKLPVRPKDKGEFMLGGTNRDLYDSNPVRLRVIDPSREEFFPDQWTVPASYIDFATDRPLNMSLGDDSFAVLDAGSPYLILPDELAKNLTLAIGAQDGPYWFRSIPCERRQELPLLTFNLSGHNFSISAFEYTLEVDIPNAGTTCLTTFWEGSEFFPRNFKGIVLGSPFIRGFYSIWDMGNREVGCMYSSQSMV